MRMDECTEALAQYIKAQLNFDLPRGRGLDINGPHLTVKGKPYEYHFTHHEKKYVFHVNTTDLTVSQK